MRKTETELVICPECNGVGYTTESFPFERYSCELCEGCGRTYKRTTVEYKALDKEARSIARILQEE